MRISDWSSDVCSSDLRDRDAAHRRSRRHRRLCDRECARQADRDQPQRQNRPGSGVSSRWRGEIADPGQPGNFLMKQRSEEHTSELQSLMRISYAVFCLKKKKNKNTAEKITYIQ